jgi:hypothetical protein
MAGGCARGEDRTAMSEAADMVASTMKGKRD